MSRLQGKKAIITGGSNGIGRAIVEAFLREGADVLFTMYQDTQAAEELKAYGQRLGRQVDFVQVDATQSDHIDKLIAKAVAFLSHIDVLVNNSAVISRTEYLNITPELYERILNANLRFPFFTIQQVARQMIAAGNGGSIINISSVSSFKAISGMAHYQCSKAALSMLTKSTAYELGPHGIRVNTISPGLTATKANRNQWRDNPELWAERGEGIPLGRTGVPEDHAGAAVFLAADESSWMSGGDLVIDGGHAAL